MEEKDQLFFNMYRAALGWLQNSDPKEIARRANVIFDGDAFHLKSLGQDISVTYPHYQIQPWLQQWHVLTILHYLAKADGTALSGELISFSQHKDGLIRGGGFDANAESMIRDRLGLLSEQELLRRCRLLGGEVIPGNADLCVRFSYLPNYPVYLKIWFADDEFPPSGRMLLDASAEHYLTIEDAVTIGELLFEKLCNPTSAVLAPKTAEAK